MTKYTYIIETTPYGETILRSDGWSIPKDPTNADYQLYLEDEAKIK
jgi:hypothetical protein